MDVAIIGKGTMRLLFTSCVHKTPDATLTVLPPVVKEDVYAI